MGSPITVHACIAFLWPAGTQNNLRAINYAHATVARPPLIYSSAFCSQHS